MQFRSTASGGISQITHQPETDGKYKHNAEFESSVHQVLALI